MKICIGYSSKTGEILEDFDKAKACNLCANMRLYGLHGFVGNCEKRKEEISFVDYRKMAQDCESFDCKPEHLRP